MPKFIGILSLLVVSLALTPDVSFALDSAKLPAAARMQAGDRVGSGAGSVATRVRRFKNKRRRRIARTLRRFGVHRSCSARTRRGKPTVTPRAHAAPELDPNAAGTGLLLLVGGGLLLSERRRKHATDVPLGG